MTSLTLWHEQALCGKLQDLVNGKDSNKLLQVCLAILRGRKDGNKLLQVCLAT